MTNNEEFVPQGAEPTEFPQSYEGKNVLRAEGGTLTASGSIGAEPIEPQKTGADSPVDTRMLEEFQTEEQRKADSIHDIFDYLKEGEKKTSEEVKTETPASVSVSNPPPSQTPELPIQSSPEWETEKQSYLEKIQQLESQLTFVRELESNPREAIAKYLPGFIVNKESPYHFDRDSYASNKISEKYGDNFVYVESDSFKPGTPTYQYRRDVTQWENEADQTMQTATNSYAKIQQEQQEKFEQSKLAVMQKYGMDEVSFNSNIKSVLEGMQDSDRLMLLADAIMVLKGSNTAIQQAKDTNALRRQPPSPTDVKGASRPKSNSKEQKMVEELVREFGIPSRRLSSY